MRGILETLHRNKKGQGFIESLVRGKTEEMIAIGTDKGMIKIEEVEGIVLY